MADASDPEVFVLSWYGCLLELSYRKSYQVRKVKKARVEGESSSRGHCERAHRNSNQREFGSCSARVLSCVTRSLSKKNGYEKWRLSLEIL